MKKLLSIAAVAALLSTSAVAVPNQVELTGSILPAAQVSFGAAPTGTLTGGTFMFEGASIPFNNLVLGVDTPKEQDVYVKTNSNTGVTMTISDPVNGGDMVTTTGETLKMEYSLLGNPVNVPAEDLMPLVNGANLGTLPLGKFLAVAQPTPNQVSGNYSTTLNITIAQK